MRHATTEWNRIGRIQGHGDSPLSPAGKTMVMEWIEPIRTVVWDQILCSDLGRARATAELINSFLHIPLETDPRLREMDWGQWTGLTRPEIRERFPEILKNEDIEQWSFSPPDGESYLQVRGRGLQALREAAGRMPGIRYLVVTHEGLMKCLYYRPEDHGLPKNVLTLMKPWRIHILAGTKDGLRLEIPNAIRLNPGHPDHDDLPGLP